MPIKFRCQKCRQFLGISRNQAGQVVDCPTCGRATRVPNLDGTVDPLPGTPGLDSADSSLISALDQLAQLGEDEPADDGPPEARPAQPESAGPGPRAAPIALEPLAPAEAVDPPERPKAAIIEPETAATPGPDVLSDLAAQADPATASTSPRTGSGPGAGLYILVVVAMALFAAGWAFGRFSAPEPTKPTDDPSQPPVTVADPKRTPIDGIVGRVTYRKSESECVPDRGSRVIVWPVGLNAQPPLKLDGFRAGDPEELVRTAADALARFGGGIALADDDGNFELPLPSGGDYEVLFLSRFSGRQIDEDGITPSHLARLKGCFSEPDRLIGRTQYRLLRLKFRGDGEQLLDHVFEVAD